MYFVFLLDLITGFQNGKHRCTLEDICVLQCEVGGILALWAVITVHLHLAMKDDMSPFAICSLSYCESLQTSSLTLCVLQVHCDYLWLGVEGLWRKPPGVLAALQQCLPPGQWWLNGPIWTNILAFWRGNGVCIIQVDDTSYSFCLPLVLPPLSSSGSRLLFSHQPLPTLYFDWFIVSTNFGLITYLPEYIPWERRWFTQGKA